MKIWVTIVVFVGVVLAGPVWGQWFGWDVGPGSPAGPTPAQSPYYWQGRPVESLCQDGIDNDDDGRADCRDRDCQMFGSGNAGDVCVEKACNDGQDNDGDGPIDCQDRDCYLVNACSAQESQCADGQDNDADGFTDCRDGDCRYVFATGQIPGQLSCNEQNCGDGIDNDNDGTADCEDEECVYAFQCEIERSCSDGRDNDGDRKADCEDADCTSGQSFSTCGTELCYDQIDNNGNGLVDCNDQDCFNYGQGPYNGCPISAPQGQEGNIWFGNLCSDRFDNDHNGLTDCGEPNCANACAGSPAPTSGVIPESILGSGVQRAVAGTGGVLAVVAIASSVVSVASATASAQSGPELLRSLLPFSAVHRRQTPWGRVVEQRSNKPIAGVILSLIDETGKVRATETSRRDGTFGFFVPPGTYRIVAQQEGYQFPAPAPEVALFPGENVYDGGWIPIMEESVLALVVVGQELSHTALANITERLQGVWTQVRVWQARLAMPLLLVGGALTLLSFWNRPSVLLGILLGVYLLLLILELLLTRVARRTVGTVRDVFTKKGVGLAVVRLTDQFGRLVATRVTLGNGHFFLMPAPGKYRVEIVHPNYQLYIKERIPVLKFIFGVAGIRASLLPK